MPGMEKGPSVPKKANTFEDYPKSYKFDVFEMKNLKAKAELVPITNSGSIVVGSIRLDD